MRELIDGVDVSIHFEVDDPQQVMEKINGKANLNLSVLVWSGPIFLVWHRIAATLWDGLDVVQIFLSNRRYAIYDHPREVITAF